MTQRLTEDQLDEIERHILTPHRQITMPTMRARLMLEEIRDLRDTVRLLQMKVDGSRAIVDAVEAAARVDVDTKLSAIQIERPNGPPFYLVDALIAANRGGTVVSGAALRVCVQDQRDAFFAEVVDQLARQAVLHRAVQHPYLRALEEGTLPDLRWAIVDFADHYYGYSAHFPRYLTTVISRLEEPEHRVALLRNLTEESGRYAEHDLQELEARGIQREWIEGIPHPALFRRFCKAIGAQRGQSDGNADQVVVWRDMLLSVLAHGSPAEAIGALGLGTEGIVRAIYAPITRAIERLGLLPRDTVFFPLHTVVDDDHQETLLAIAKFYARRSHPDLRRGMLKALQLRSVFWDWLYARALDPARAQEVL